MSSRGHKQEALSTAAKIRFIKVGLLVAVCVGLIACTVETDLGPDGLKDLREGQKAILERIEKIEKTQKKMLASLQKRSPNKPTVDYNKVYDIRIGQSPVRGAKDAKVTGTPTLFLNGKRVQNRSEEAMKQEIKTLLEGKKKS